MCKETVRWYSNVITADLKKRKYAYLRHFGRNKRTGKKHLKKETSKHLNIKGGGERERERRKEGGEKELEANKYTSSQITPQKYYIQ